MREFKTGEILPNGATVIEVKPKGDGRIVLAKWPKGEGKEYVTWAMDEEGGCYWGNYYRDFEAAVKNFMER